MNKKLGLLLFAVFLTLFVGVGLTRSVGITKIAEFSKIVLVSQVSAYNVPAYDGFVNDFADVLAFETERELELKLTTLASEENGAEIAVVTIESLEDDYIESVAQDFFDEWGIGKKNADNGVLLILAIEDKEIRIQTGYGAEVFLTDASSGRIIRDVMAPALKKKDYDKAVSLGVSEIAQASKRIDQKELVVSKPSNQATINTLNTATSLLIFFSIIGTYLASFLGRSKSWWTGGVIGLLSGALVVGMKYSFVVGLVGLLFDYILSKNYKKWQLEHKTTAWKKTLGGFRSGSASSSNSGISFGGGRSGGGGASGKW